MGRQHIVVGAGVKCYINGKDVGACAEFDFESHTPRKEIHAIDSLLAFEHAQTQCSVLGTVHLLRTYGDGGIQARGIAAGFLDLPREKYFTVMLIERPTNKLLFRAVRCSVWGETWRVRAKEMMQGSFQFKGIEWDNQFSQVPG